MERMRQLALILVLALPTAGRAELLDQKETLRVDEIERVYHLFVPDSAGAAAPAPLLVLFHGSYSNGRDMIRAWSPLAQREGLTLVAPDALDYRWWQIKEDGPAFVRAVIEAVAAKLSVDSRRVYLFGHSGGAVYALTLALLESEYFAAGAIHAGAWVEPKGFLVLPHAQRKIPVNLYAGDRDPFFPLATVRKTDAALRQAGHPGSLTVIRRHDHSYIKVAPQVNQSAWEFMRSVSLEGEPRFQPYE